MVGGGSGKRWYGSINNCQTLIIYYYVNFLHTTKHYFFSDDRTYLGSPKRKRETPVAFGNDNISPEKKNLLGPVQHGFT